MTGRALVTGATGMLGSYIVEVLRERGWTVHGLARSRSAAAWLEARGTCAVEGRLEDPGSLVAAARGQDVVFHAAAAIGSGGDWERFHRINVEGTQSLVDAAATSGARLVHVSSTAVYGDARYDAIPTDEDARLPRLPEHDVYGRSKQDAEAVVREAGGQGRLWASIVRPPVMYGLRDRQFAPRVGPLLARGFFPRIAGGRTTLTLVHARHVAEGAVLAASEEQARGRAYLLADDFPVTVTDLVSAAERALDRRIVAPALPMPVGRLGFCLVAGALRLAGRGSVARHASGTLAMLTRDNPFTSARARRELGWTPWIAPGTGLADALRDWASHSAAGAGRAGS
jgi:nucleoside-diphosphate-sugar epimerase